MTMANPTHELAGAVRPRNNPTRTMTRRTRIHCSIDVLFHLGTLWVTRAVAARREPAKWRAA